MAEVALRWPDLDKPASKADVIRTLVNVQGCLIEVYAALAVLQAGDSFAAGEKIESLVSNIRNLNETMDAIGGTRHGS